MGIVFVFMISFFDDLVYSGFHEKSGYFHQFRVGATRWSQWLDTVAAYYPTPIESNNPYRSRHLLRGEMCMEGC